MSKSNFIASIPYIKMSKHNKKQEATDCVIKEERIALYLNGTKILSTMSIPQDQDAHAIGFLLSEGVIENIDDVLDVSIEDSGLSVKISAKIQEENMINLYKEKTLTSGCCVGVTGNFEGKIIEKFISSQVRVHIDVIWHILEIFYKDNKLFDKTGCVHKALLIDKTGENIAEAFDVGRHNAIDKVVGKARMQKKNLSEAILFVSGRLSLEMVIKSAMHDIPIVVSKAATTQLAIQSAQKLGITLIGFARENRCNIYTHSSRVLD
ncbi:MULTISPECIES: formate dehydrogenase accessory sulfurtransferase FdhD [unclassified Helicobacter]|uniref:formate dehydrogenase accessory sulfurtransferase FdhD n=1 Tax=unclassified Helicobacter TaxID=2593540 RepID=UPI000CF1BACA|nr:MULTISPECIES: formate dehydrogenase accessory sulfurtransferase FdhD [unclassified Helicobacter]